MLIFTVLILLLSVVSFIVGFRLNHIICSSDKPMRMFGLTIFALIIWTAGEWLRLYQYIGTGLHAIINTIVVLFLIFELGAFAGWLWKERKPTKTF